MNDYKELLSQIACCTSEESCNGCPLNSDNILDSCVDELLEKASDAIEQLCEDVARLEAENRAKEQYIAETIGKVIKERDAAIADLKDMHRKYLVDGKGKCFACKNDVFDCDKSTCAGCDYTDNFEWRGVQEVEHETD